MLPLPFHPFLFWCQFSSLRAEEKREKLRSEIGCPVNLPNPVPWYSRCWKACIPKQRGGDGHPLFLFHSDMPVNTHGVPWGQEAKAVPDRYFPSYGLGRTLTFLGKGMAKMAWAKQNLMFREERRGRIQASLTRLQSWTHPPLDRWPWNLSYPYYPVLSLETQRLQRPHKDDCEVKSLEMWSTLKQYIRHMMQRIVTLLECITFVGWGWGVP